jgi:uncharacterized repeat protein (TIGR02543 family)
MNKRYRIISLFAASVIFLASCTGISSSKAEYNVYFFTANTGATQLDTYFDANVGETILRPEDPSRPGFVFAGWFIDYAKTLPWDFETDLMPERSLVLYAKFDVTVRNIVYNLNGGTISALDYPTTFSPGQSFVLPRARKTGYSFRGWFLYDQVLENFPNNEGTRPGDVGINSLPSTVIEDFIIYAHWSAIKAVVTFRANHPLGTSVISNPGSRTVTYGTVIQYGVNFPEDLGTVSDYVFIGWNSRANGTGDWYADGEVFTRTLAITLFGQWQPVVD